MPTKISFFIKTKDFKFITATVVLPTPTSIPEIIIPLIFDKFESLHKKGVLYRTTGVTFHNLSQGHSQQGDLFGGTDKIHKFELIHDQIDKLESKFGKHVVYLASTKKALENERGVTDADDLDRNLLFL